MPHNHSHDLRAAISTRNTRGTGARAGLAMATTITGRLAMTRPSQTGVV
jgi:hypothetical protein